MAGMTTSVINAQTVLFEDSFETYTDFAIANVGNWTLTDVDLKPTYGFNGITFLNSGVAKSFQVFNSTTTTPAMTPSATSDWTAKTGNKVMVSFGATSAPWSNDWLISPAIQLLSDGGTLSFWGKGCDSTYGAEKFKVLVSTTGTAVANFTAISPLITTPSDAAWHEYTYSLSAYAGQTVYIAIQCTSDDQFGFAVDDFKVTSSISQTQAPGCAAALSPANAANNVSYKTPVNLSWSAPTTGGTASNYDVYFGTSANPSTLLGNYTGTSATIPVAQIAPATTYYWKVVPKNNIGSATGCTDFTFTTQSLPASAPDCATLNTPANATTGIDYLAAVNLTWTAPTTGTVVDSYDVYMDTNPNPTTLLGNKTTTSHTVAAGTLSPSTTYYWKVVPKNDTGSSTGCSVFSFTTKANPFAPYCGPLAFTTTVEPITLVNFAGINNTSAAATAGATAHEDFTSISGNVVAGSSYTITLKGNTNGSYTNRFVVFIDWNQNGVLDNAGEVYQITQTILNSTGTDAIQATQSIAVPATAMAGNTRMRVKKIFGTTNYLLPCSGTSYGQAEDYTLTVSPATAAVSDISKVQAKVYPNPVVDVLNVEAAGKVKSLSIYDLSGKVVSTHVMNAVKSQVNLSKLAPGVYVVNIETENGTQSVKVVKK